MAMMAIDWPAQEKPATRWSEPAPTVKPAAAGQEVAVEWREKPDTLKDVGKAVAAEGVKGALADTVGLIGTAGHYWDKATELPLQGAAWAAEKMGLLPEGKTAEGLVKGVRAAGDALKTPAEQRGDVNRIFGLPFATQQGAEKAVEKYLPFTAYKPQTTEGKVAASAARFGAGSLPFAGGVAGIPRALGVGAVSGAASEGAGQLTEGSAYEPAARLAGAVAGGMAGTKVVDTARMMFKPTKSAEEALRAALAKDMAEGTLKTPWDNALAMIDKGDNIALADIGGPNTQKLLQTAAFKSSAGTRAMSDYQRAAEQRAGETGAVLRQHIDDMFGQTLNPAAQQEAMKAANKVQMDRLYDIARNDPAAQTVVTPGLGALLNIDAVKKVARRATSMATDPQAGINLPSSPTGPNLGFWHKVKTGLDDEYKALTIQGRNDEARSLLGIRDRLLSEIDTAVPAYKAARGVASDAFKAENAIEAGTRAMRDMDAFKGQKITAAMAKMPPAERNQFAQGAAGYLAEYAAKNGPDRLMREMSKPAVAERARAAIGASQYDSIMGRAAEQSLLAHADILKNPAVMAAAVGHPWLTSGATGIIGAAGSALTQAVVTGASPASPSHLMVGAIAAAMAMGGQKMATGANARIATRLAEAATKGQESGNFEALGKLIASDAEARKFAFQVAEKLGKVGMAQYRANPQQPEPDRVGRATGGRVGDHERLVSRLMKAADDAKKRVNGTTEHLLDTPDSTIAKALATANAAI